MEQLHLYSQLKQEYGSSGIEALLRKAEQSLQTVLEELKTLPVDAALAQREPDDLPGILKIRPDGPRRLWNSIDQVLYKKKLEGALLGRMAGNILGVPVEGWTPKRMEDLARENDEPFPPVKYWKYVPQPFELMHGVSPRAAYSRSEMAGVPVDDDLTYTLLGLFIIEEYGPDFSTKDVANAWLKYLPFGYTAEEITLKNLKAGLPALDAGEHNNPFTEWIGADIRADPWGYLAPGHPKLAAELAYRDAYLSHRRQGIYGEMFFAAAIAAAFHVQDPLDAVKIGLTEIPADCQLAHHTQWALAEAPQIKNYRQARKLVDERFAGMSGAHTLNNACLTIFGLAIGGTDLTRVIGETVAMGLDNDCTAATAGSIVGAVVGKAGIPPHWYQNFNNRIATYMNATPQLELVDIIERFTAQAIRVYSSHTRQGTNLQ